MVVNLHLPGGGFYNLGMIRIINSMPAEVASNLQINVLKKFGIDMNRDIIATITHGASVMIKMGKLAPPKYFVCQAHGFYLAVLDALYPKKVSDFSTINLLLNDESESSDFESEVCSLEYQSTDNITIDDLDEIILLVLQIVRKLRRSPLVNDTLQKYSKDEFGKELTLIHVTKTRWNSTLEMLCTDV